MLASIGDEQGLEAKANTAPTINGNINKLPPLFSGIFFMRIGNLISKKPVRFSPKTIIKDEKTIRRTGVAKPVKARPVSAHKTPIMLNIRDKPTEKESIWIKSFLFFSFEKPPTYPIIRGNMPIPQGDIEAIIPAVKAAASAKGIIMRLS